MILKLKYYGDEDLRKKALPVDEITDEIRTLTNNMIETMVANQGCGLAATQVGVMLRLFVSNIDHEDDEGIVHYGEPCVYINPILSNPSAIFVERGEGCLSIPKLYAPVERPLSITIEAMDLTGKKFKRETTRFLARNIMHENDHLNGVLFIDRIKGKKRKELEPILRQIKTQYAS